MLFAGTWNLPSPRAPTTNLITTKINTEPEFHHSCKTPLPLLIKLKLGLMDLFLIICVDVAEGGVGRHTYCGVKVDGRLMED